MRMVHDTSLVKAKLPNESNGDGEPLAADAAVQALDHAIALRRTRAGVAILGAAKRNFEHYRTETHESGTFRWILVNG
jgi:hypothetical protein